MLQGWEAAHNAKWKPISHFSDRHRLTDGNCLKTRTNQLRLFPCSEFLFVDQRFSLSVITSFPRSVSLSVHLQTLLSFNSHFHLNNFSPSSLFYQSVFHPSPSSYSHTHSQWFCGWVWYRELKLCFFACCLSDKEPWSHLVILFFSRLPCPCEIWYLSSSAGILWIEVLGYIWSRRECSGTLCQEPQKSDYRCLKVPTARPVDGACCRVNNNLTQTADFKSWCYAIYAERSECVLFQPLSGKLV